jgi:hemerythrin
MRGWGDDLNTGYEELDREHRVLLGLAHDAVDVVQDGTPFPEALKVLEKFVDYASRHFDTEEGLMQTFQYPDMEAHMAEHMEMRLQLRSVLDRYKTKGGNSSLTGFILRGTVRQWIKSHIKREDAALVTFLANQVRLTEE